MHMSAVGKKYSIYKSVMFSALIIFNLAISVLFSLFLYININKYVLKKYTAYANEYVKSQDAYLIKNKGILNGVTKNIAYEYNIEIKPDVYIPKITNGLAPAIRRLDTKQKVVFLGIDDGAYKNPKVIEIMKKNKIRSSMFLADRFINDNRDFFKDLIPLGSKIENHTLNHKLLSQLPYEEQKTEICGMADLEEKVYGRRPVLFRPPGGDYNTDTQRAAADCGMKAVVLWIAKANGGSMQYQGDKKLHPGDIVLMHFRPEFEQDMQAFVDAQNAAGLKTVLLDRWIK